jgi:hypothetical protein
VAQTGQQPLRLRPFQSVERLRAAAQTPRVPGGRGLLTILCISWPVKHQVLTQLVHAPVYTPSAGSKLCRGVERVAAAVPQTSTWS